MMRNDPIMISSLPRLQQDDVIQSDAAQTTKERVAIPRERDIAGAPGIRGSRDVSNRIPQRGFVVALRNHGR